MQAKPFAVVILLVATCGCGLEGGRRDDAAAAADVSSPYESVTLALPVGRADAGRQAFLDLKCATCHRVSGETAFPAPFSDHPGPELDPRRPRRSPSDVATAIVAPSHALSTRIGYEQKARLEGEHSPMGSFNEVMTVQQLGDLVAYLRSAAVTP